MRPIRPLLISALLLVVPAACHHGGAAPAPTLPPLMIDDRGVVMPLEEAVKNIDYRPWVPAGSQILKIAVIPALGGDKDTPQNRGLAIEYENNRVAWLLSQWPKQNFTLLFLHGQDITNAPCSIAHYKRDGVAWTTAGKLAMTLQPDGSVAAKTVDAEARRLIAAGACKDPASRNR